MAKIKVSGSSIIITSVLKDDDIRLVKRSCPNALTLYEDEEKQHPIFAIDLGDTGYVSEAGIEFNGSSRNRGLAQATIVDDYIGYCGTNEELKKYIVDEYSVVMSRLNRLEQQALELVAEVTQARDTFASQIILDTED